MADGVLGTGISGLLTAQRSLATASHNIANVNTPGYSRQRVETGTRTPLPFGDGFVGTGVQIEGINRLYDQFNTLQVRTATSGTGQAQQFHDLASQVDNLLADSQAGLMPALQGFFNAVQGVANEPQSASARQVLLSEANSLEDRFRYLDQRFTDLSNNVNASIADTVDNINSITSAIANINRDILTASSNAGGLPNDLLDRRDELLRQLSEKVSVSTVDQGDGTLNVFIGNGQAVVAGIESRTLSVVQNAYDPSKSEIAYDTPQGAVRISDQLSGGALGGMLEFRGQVLDPARNSLGQLAIGLAATFNAQHRLGLDLNGNLGGDLFAPLDTQTTPPIVDILPGEKNSGVPAAQLSATIADAGQLTASDYKLERNGSTYTLTRLSDNTVTKLTTFPGGTETVDGLALSLTSGSIADGDTFLIKPTLNGAANFSVLIADPAKIAAAVPVQASSDLTNTGTGAIDAGTVTDATAYVPDTYTITFTTPTTYEVRDSASVLQASGTYTAGAAITFNGIEVKISGVPANGDTFTVAPNTGGVGDNRNALSLAALQTQLTLGGGVSSFGDIYSQMVSDVGTKTRQADINSTAQQSLLDWAVQTQQQKSGVNLDEEAANIIRFQQAYQAAARVISAADTMFQTLLDTVRR